MSEHNITVEGGSSVRLPTAGKYCDRDIVVTATGGGIPDGYYDASGLNVDESKVLAGEIYIDEEGHKIGTMPQNSQMRKTISYDGNDRYDIPEGYHPPGGYVQVDWEDATVTPSKSKQIITPGKRLTLREVTVNPIPNAYIIPQGEKEITENGQYDVSSFASVNVNVAGGTTEPDPRDQYQRVEYIESAEEGTYPYIITDVYADNSTGVEIIASFPTLQDRIPMGSRQDSGTTRFYCVYPMSANSIYYGFNTGSSVSCPLKVNTIYRCQTNFLNSRLVNVYDEAGIRKGGASLSATLTPHTVPMSIFGYYAAASGTVNSKREYKLYSARVSKGHEIYREYIPCYRKSDGVVGLYEKVTGQFLTNDADTGSFAKGADIDW